MSGEVLAIVGRSGAGKSVLLKNLIGLLRPDRGSVVVAGEDLHRARGRRLSRLRERFGMLFQGGALFDSLSVADNVAFPLREKTRQSPGQIADMVAEMLKNVGLQGMDDKFPAELSGGMRKRTALARALAHRPEIMLFDEPTTGLDPIMVRAIHRLIADTQQQFQYTRGGGQSRGARNFRDCLPRCHAARGRVAGGRRAQRLPGVCQPRGAAIHRRSSRRPAHAHVALRGFKLGGNDEAIPS